MAGLLDFLGGSDVELRNNQQVGPAAKDVTGRGFRVYDNLLEGPKATVAEAAKKGRGGVLGALGAGLAAKDLFDGANNAWGQGAWDRAQDIANKRDVRLAVEQDPGLPQRGVDTVQRITGNAMEGVRGLMDQGRVAAAERTPTNVGRSLPLAPEKKAEAAAATQDPAVEAGRQRLAAGTLQGLQSGEVHVSDLAKGVVQADAQRAGTELKPEEEKAAVAAEVQAMKTMDKAQLSEYVSYALIAGGLLASVFDKSGEAGRMFHDSLNKQLDRNLAAGKMSIQQQQAAAELALNQRKVDVNEKDVDSKIKDRTRSADQQDEKIGILKDDSATKKFSAQSQADLGKQRLGIMSEGNRLRAEGLAIQRGEAASKQAYRQSKIDNPSGSTPKGVPLSFKDSATVVNDVYKSRDQKVDGALKSQLAARLPTLQKQYPELSPAELVELAEGELDTEIDSGWINDTVRVRQPK